MPVVRSSLYADAQTQAGPALPDLSEKLGSLRESLAGLVKDLGDMGENIQQTAVQTGPLNTALAGAAQSVESLANASLEGSNTIKDSSDRFQEGLAELMAQLYRVYDVTRSEGFEKQLPSYDGPLGLGDLFLGELGNLFGGIFHEGGRVEGKGGQEEVLAKLQVGEGVLTEKGMEAVGGAAGLERLNQGLPLKPAIQVQVNLTDPQGPWLEQVAQEIRRLLSEERGFV